MFMSKFCPHNTQPKPINASRYSLLIQARNGIVRRINPQVF